MFSLLALLNISNADQITTIHDPARSHAQPSKLLSPTKGNRRKLSRWDSLSRIDSCCSSSSSSASIDNNAPPLLPSRSNCSASGYNDSTNGTIEKRNIVATRRNLFERCQSSSTLVDSKKRLNSRQVQPFNGSSITGSNVGVANRTSNNSTSTSGSSYGTKLPPQCPPPLYSQSMQAKRDLFNMNNNNNNNTTSSFESSNPNRSMDRRNGMLKQQSAVVRPSSSMSMLLLEKNKSNTNNNSNMNINSKIHTSPSSSSSSNGNKTIQNLRATYMKKQCSASVLGTVTESQKRMNDIPIRRSSGVNKSMNVLSQSPQSQSQSKSTSNPSLSSNKNTITGTNRWKSSRDALSSSSDHTPQRPRRNTSIDLVNMDLSSKSEHSSLPSGRTTTTAASVASVNAAAAASSLSSTPISSSGYKIPLSSNMNHAVKNTIPKRPKIVNQTPTTTMSPSRNTTTTGTSSTVASQRRLLKQDSVTLLRSRQ